MAAASLARHVEPVGATRTPGSFVRPRPPQRIVALAATPQSVEIDLCATALLVIDMQNDFLHPEGWAASRGADLTPLRPVIPHLERLTARLRRAGVPVIWVNWGVRPDHANLSASFVERARGTHGPSYGDPAPSGRGRILVRDDWGAATIAELTTDPADVLVHKHRLSSFWDNELDSILRQRGITTLLFGGINTDRCVFTSLQDANFLGYDCVLVEDACATTSPDFVREAVLYLVRLTHGVVADIAAVAAACDAERSA
ncbi:MAG: isochorismatase family cysteine hydrolase [Deltaproteobacteria bacterium]|nr:isochorismatase family cysteine hydrolase [Deltaproteobacteria bacterium]